MTVTERVTGVLTLRPSVFEDIEADKHANLQAFAVVVTASMAIRLLCIDFLLGVRVDGTGTVRTLHRAAG